MSISQTLIRSILLSAMLFVVGCNTSYGVRKTVGFPGLEKRDVKPPLEYKAEEGLPYTQKLTYGEICVDSKRLGKEYCFPCYASGQGGCEGAMQDLIDKAIVCSASIGPAIPTLPTYPTVPQVSYAPLVQQPQYLPLMTGPTTYPNYSR